MKLDLISSQPVPVASRLTDYFSAPKGDSVNYSIEEVSRVTQGLIDAFTQEGIKGFEKDRNIVRLHERLQAAPERDRLRLSKELKDAKAKVYIERHDFMQMVSDFQGVCGAVAAFARPDVANQVQVVSSHFVNIGVQVAGLVGYGPLASPGAVTPIGFGSAILTAVGQISSLFAKKRGITFERATLDAIAILSQQVHQLREEMHSRFDDVQFQMFLMNSDIMIQFGLVHQEIGHIAQKLEHIHTAMASNHRQLEYTLSSIGQSITDLEREFTDSETRREVRKLSKLINPVLFSIGGHYMTREEFTKLSDELLAAVHSTLKQKELAGTLVNLADGVIAKWQPMEHSGHWVNYHINAVLAYAAATMGYRLGQPVNNPILLCYVTLALILINRRRYVASQEPFASRVSTLEVEAIDTVVTEIRATQEALVPLREPRLYAALLQQIQASVQDFQQAYTEAIKVFQSKNASQFELAYERSLDAIVVDPAKGYQGKPLRITSSLIRRILSTLSKPIQHAAELGQLQLRFQYFIKDSHNLMSERFNPQGVTGNAGVALIMDEMNKLDEKTFKSFLILDQFHLQLSIEGKLCYSVVLPYEKYEKVHTIYIDEFDPTLTPNQAKKIDIDAINAFANQHIKEIYRVLREQFNESVRHQIESDHKSALGKAITAFDANIKRLKALLALAFPYVYSHPHDLYRLIHGGSAPLSRQDCLDYLENNPSSHGLELFEKLNEFVSVLERHLVPLIISLRPTASNQLLDVALKELQDWLGEYKPTAVLRNEVAPLPKRVQESDVLRANALHIAQLKAALTAIARTVNGLPSDMAQVFLEQTRAHLTTIVDEHPHLMGDTGANGSSDSVARMIVGNGGPVFRVPGGNIAGRTLPAPGDGTPTYKLF